MRWMPACAGMTNESGILYISKITKPPGNSQTNTPVLTVVTLWLLTAHQRLNPAA
jgi:hypothetical protein